MGPIIRRVLSLAVVFSVCLATMSAEARPWRRRVVRRPCCAPLYLTDYRYCAIEQWDEEPPESGGIVRGLFLLTECDGTTCMPGTWYWEWLDIAYVTCPDDCLDGCDIAGIAPLRLGKPRGNTPPPTYAPLDPGKTSAEYEAAIRERMPAFLSTKSNMTRNSHVANTIDPELAITMSSPQAVKLELYDRVQVGCIRKEVNLNKTIEAVAFTTVIRLEDMAPRTLVGCPQAARDNLKWPTTVAELGFERTPGGDALGPFKAYREHPYMVRADITIGGVTHNYAIATATAIPEGKP